MPADLNTRPNIFVLIDEAHRTTGGDLGNYLMAGAAERRLHRLHRHAGGQDRLRQGHVQDLRQRRRQGLPAQVLDRARASRTARRCRSTTTSRPTRCSCQHGADGEGVLVARRDRGDHRHRGAEQDPRPRGEPEELPQGRRARGQGRPVRRRALREERRAAGLQGVPGRRGPRGVRQVQGGARQVPAAGILGGRLHRQQQRHRRTEEVPHRREEGEADPQGLRQGRQAAEDPDRHGEAAHRVTTRRSCTRCTSTSRCATTRCCRRSRASTGLTRGRRRRTRDASSRTASCSTSSASSTSWRRRWRSTATRSTRSSRTSGC